MIPRSVLLPAVLALAAWASATRAESPADTQDKAALLKLEQDWADAVARHDAAFIERVEADTYVYTDATGNVAHKNDDLDNARAGALKVESFQLTGMKVQVHGDAAVVTGQTALVGSDHGGTLTGTYRWTDVFVRHPGGDWQVTASQATAVGKPDEPAVVTIPAETPAAAMPADTPPATDTPAADRVMEPEP